MSRRIETENLVLRRLVAEDLDDLVALDSDPEVMHFLTGGLPTSRQEIARERLPRWLASAEGSEYLGFWAAGDKTSGAFVGWFHLLPASGAGADEVELGYRLQRRVWGRGYATEGSRALIDRTFADPGVRRVVAETMVVHVASRRVMEKAGMEVARYFRADWPYKIPGDEHGDVEYAADRETWRP